MALLIGSALVSLAFCGGLFYVFFIGLDSETISMPQMRIAVTDEEGVPVPGATVVIEHSTQPHHRLEERVELTADDHGLATTDLVVTTEKIYPLCMHGVPGHQHYVCIAHPGAMPVVLQLEETRDPIAIEVPLRRDPSNTHSCTDDVNAMFFSARTPRGDIESADHVSSAREP